MENYNERIVWVFIFYFIIENNFSNTYVQFPMPYRPLENNTAQVENSRVLH